MTLQITRPISIVAMTAIAAAALTACSGGDDDAPGTVPTPANGTLALALQTNAPSCGLEAINVTISKLRVHTDATAAANAAGWTEIALTPRKVNLLNAATVLSGATTALGQVSVAPAAYTQIRAVLDTSAGASSVRVAGATADVALETAAALGTDGIKVPTDLRVASSATTTGVFDLDGCNSIQRRGTAYVLKPWARPVPTELNGISGFINTTALAGTTITAQVTGSIYATAVPHPTTGEFRLPRLPAGNYDVVIQSPGRVTAAIGAVPVTASAITAISTAAAPLALATSATSTINGKISFTAPAAAPDSGAWVQASQAVAANVNGSGNVATVITYRFQPTDLATGTFSLTSMPRNFIQFAPYKAGQVLVPANVATANTNGRYNVSSVVTGYTTKTTATNPVNASTADVNGADIVVTP